MVEPEAREAADRKEVLIISDPVAALELSILYLKKRNKDPRIQAIIEGLGKVWLQSPGNNTLLSMS